MWGAKPPKPSLGQRLSDFSRTLQEKTTDKFAGINALGPEAERYTALVAGAPEAAVERSREVLGSVGRIAGSDARAVDDFLHLQHMAHVVEEKGPGRLIAGGIKGKKDIAAAFGELEDSLGPERFVSVRRAAEAVRQHYADLLDRKVEAGLVSAKDATVLRQKYPWYNPIVYIKGLDEQVVGVGGRELSVTRSGLKQLSDVGLETARERPLNSLGRATLESELFIARNLAARAIIRDSLANPEMAGQLRRVSGVRPVAQVEAETIFRRPQGELRGTISFMEDGKRVIYDVPQWLENEAKHLAQMPLTDVERVGHFLNAVPRMAITGKNPIFFVSNFAIDTLTAWMTEGANPLRSFRRLAVNLRNLKQGDQTLQEMLKSGGGFGGYSGRLPEQLAEDIRKSGNAAILTPKDLRAFNPLTILGDVGRAVEQAPRSAVYELALQRGLSPAEAALAARRATVDFARSGTAIKQLNALFLYLNAGVQGTMIPLRAMKDSVASRWRVGGLMAATAGVYAWNRQFEEFKDVPGWAKYNSLIIMLPSNEYDAQGRKKPRYVSLIPNMREWGAFTGVVSYVLGRLDEESPEDAMDFIRTIGANLNPLSRFTGQGGLPVPTQIGETLTEMMLNRDMFRDRPIVSPELVGLPLEEQYDNRTTGAARVLGPVIGWSPLKLQHLFDGVLGGLGRSAISGVDYAMSKVAPDMPSVEAQAALDALDSLKPPLVAPDRVALERQGVLAGLSPEIRKEVLDYERRQPPGLPVVSELQRKVLREQGGQLFRTGQRAAERETGLSAKQTAEVSRAIGRVFDELDVKQKLSDEGFTSGSLNGQPYTGEMWRKDHAEYGKLYRGALLALGILYPGSAQTQGGAVWDEYRNVVYTLAGTIQDRRSRGQTLLAAYRAIQPEGPTPETTDWDAYDSRLTSFLDGLPKADQALLEEWRRASMTPVEREYDKVSVLLRKSGYWQLHRTLPVYQSSVVVAKDYEGWLKAKDNPATLQAWEAEDPNPRRLLWMKELYRQAQDAKEKLREAAPDLDAGLVRFYGLVPRTPRGQAVDYQRGYGLAALLTRPGTRLPAQARQALIAKGFSTMQAIAQADDRTLRRITGVGKLPLQAQMILAETGVGK